VLFLKEKEKEKEKENEIEIENEIENEIEKCSSLRVFEEKIDV